MESAISSLLANLVINPRDENFKDTPERVARAFKEMILSSLEIETGLDEIFSKAFPTDYTGIIFVSDITSHSVCPHHLLPVEYNSTVAYIPGNELNKVIGLSKIIRLVQLLAKQAILQETYTQQISNAFMKIIKAKGVAVVVKGLHNCIRCRGVKSLSPVITSVMDGAFMDSPSTREEFFQLLAHSRG
jgi:GTP cyclohydrolase I